jgi:hypothetical protein
MSTFNTGQINQYPAYLLMFFYARPIMFYSGSSHTRYLSRNQENLSKTHKIFNEYIFIYKVFDKNNIDL